MDKEFIRVANGVSLVSIVSNIALSVFKLIAGVLAHSSAMFIQPQTYLVPSWS